MLKSHKLAVLTSLVLLSTLVAITAVDAETSPFLGFIVVVNGLGDTEDLAIEAALAQLRETYDILAYHIVDVSCDITVEVPPWQGSNGQQPPRGCAAQVEARVLPLPGGIE